MIARARRLRRDRRGATLVELGFVMPQFVLVLLALFDFSYRMYAQSMLEGTLQRASRQATIGNKTSAQIDDYINGQLTLFSRGTPPEIEKKSFAEFSDAAKGTICKDGNVSGTPNGVVDETGEYELGVNGLGTSDDIIFYRVTLKFQRMFPLAKFLGWSDEERVSAKMVLRNQPYGSQTVVQC